MRNGSNILNYPYMTTEQYRVLERQKYGIIIKTTIIIIIIIMRMNNSSANEICAMWKQNATQVIAIVTSSTGRIPKSL
jgi:hypothetical protein